MFRACIVGYGRAGKIQAQAAQDVFHITHVIDERASVETMLDEGVTFAKSLRQCLSEVDLVIVTTPTSSHYHICKLALTHGKHVLVEKPLATSKEEIQDLYELAEQHGVLLFTAFNRRHDPEWCSLRQQLEGRYPLYANVVCRDFPFPPAAYLETCGGIFRDAAVHDLDMLCVLLGDTPVEVRAFLDETKETASTELVFSKGCRAHLIHSRHSTYYDQRVMLVGNHYVVEIGNGPVVPAMSFQERYRTSYVKQLEAVQDCLARNEFAPNVSLEHALFLERLIDACDSSARTGQPVVLKTLRAYDAAKHRVKQLYEDARRFHTVARVQSLLETYKPNQFGTLGVWDTYTLLQDFVDLSDPDVDLPNQQHALQTAESIRRAGLPDWMQLTGLIHDFGKVLYKWGRDEYGTSLHTQFSLVGDTFVVGHPLPTCLVYPEFNAHNPEAGTESVYAPSCGLDACVVSFGHDEYLYRVLNASDTRLPTQALKMIRYHSLYAWHEGNAYQELQTEADELVKGWIKLFNTHDLYSKTHNTIDLATVKDYYTQLIDKYIPHGLRF